MEKQVGEAVIEVSQFDITEMETDAIVNAANTRLVLGGGVAGAIRKKGGPEIQAQCNKISPTFVGGAVITTAGKLKAKFVIHAVGPRAGEINQNKKLSSATLNSLKLANGNNLRSISFPAISTGIYSGRQPAITPLTAIFHTDASQFPGGRTPITSFGERSVYSSIASTALMVGGIMGSPSVH